VEEVDCLVVALDWRVEEVDCLVDAPAWDVEARSVADGRVEADPPVEGTLLQLLPSSMALLPGSRPVGAGHWLKHCLLPGGWRRQPCRMLPRVHACHCDQPD